MCDLWGMEKLAQYIVNKRMTKADFARLLGTSRGHVHDLISGRRFPCVDTMLNIEDATGGKIPAEAWVALARYRRKASEAKQ